MLVIFERYECFLSFLFHGNSSRYQFVYFFFIYKLYHLGFFTPSEL